MVSSAAGFPWKADGDFRTIVYAKNESDTAQRFVTHLVYAGGEYTARELEIKPHQTLAVDFRELRDAQTPDGLRRVIPFSVDSGQIAWGKDLQVRNLITDFIDLSTSTRVLWIARTDINSDRKTYVRYNSRK